MWVDGKLVVEYAPMHEPVRNGLAFLTKGQHSIRVEITPFQANLVTVDAFAVTPGGREIVSVIGASGGKGKNYQRRYSTYIEASNTKRPAKGRFVVGKEGLEPSWIAPHAPKACAYTNSATYPSNKRPDFSRKRLAWLVRRRIDR